MDYTITVAGLVATTPRHLVTEDGLAITSFRLASTDGEETNWFTITCTKTLATNVAQSINKGERVIVAGSLRIKEWETNTASGTIAEVKVESIGHDLAWGKSQFERTVLVRDNDLEAQGVR